MTGPKKKSPGMGSPELTSCDLSHPGGDGYSVGSRSTVSPAPHWRRSSSPPPSARSACRTCRNRSPRFDSDDILEARPAADGRLRAVGSGPFAQRSRARRHDDRFPRRRDLRPAVRRRSPRRRYISTSSRSRRAGAIRTRDSSTSSASKPCAGRRARSTARAPSPGRCASSPTSPIHEARDAGSTRSSRASHDGDKGYDVSAMINVPLVADRARAAPGGLHRRRCRVHRQRA